MLAFAAGLVLGYIVRGEKRRLGSHFHARVGCDLYTYEFAHDQ
jgi:hypothetical protein